MVSIFAKKSERKQVMKKILILIAATVMMAISLSGCGGIPPNEVFNADDLEGKIIGTQLGTTGNIFAADIPDATVEAYNKAADAVMALKQGKLDAVLIDSEPGKVFAEKNPSLIILDDPFAIEEYSIAYKKGNDELGEKLDAALTTLKADGTLDEIVSHWIGDNADNVSYVPDETIIREGTLVMATNAEFPPYESMSGSNIVGIDVDMMNAVCDELGMELEIINMEFDSIIAAVNSGKADVGVAGMSVTPERLENVSFTQGYATSTQVILVRGEEYANPIGQFVQKIHSTFIEGNRWMYLVKGLGVTLLITFVSILIGCLLGLVLAIIRTTHDKTGKLKILNWMAKVYLTIIRGTPVTLQLLIIYFVIFASVNIGKVPVAMVAFGLNSAAYVAEIVRSGIMSIDKGQFEASASLGMNYPKTMLFIIMPQAIKNILPALGNEFIVLLKETSISGYIALEDLTFGGNQIRSQTFEAFMPLIAVALIYLVMVMGLSALVSLLERRLSKSDRG
ncbi:MAG: ABC transporter substrate-binding protein/permease [Oscillospiraceae bacterium]|nr:ABC transporter substrate-binding protein/permease [Oscillospiraceae bacterium]